MLSKKSQKLTPFEKWTSYYQNSKKSEQPKLVVNDDIHHFYNRTPRPSIYNEPAFTPHLSGKPAHRNSQLGGQLGSQRNSNRLSLSMRNMRNSNYGL